MELELRVLVAKDGEDRCGHKAGKQCGGDGEGSSGELRRVGREEYGLGISVRRMGEIAHGFKPPSRVEHYTGSEEGNRKGETY